MASKRFEDLNDDDVVEVLNNKEVQKKDQYAATAGTYTYWYDTYVEAEEYARTQASRGNKSYVLKPVAMVELDTSLTKVEKYV